MKIYVFPVAPNPTRLRLYLAEKALAGTRIELEEVMVNLPAGEQKTPDHLVRNPSGKLPVLELDDGSFLTESLAIVEYVEELYPDPPMIGRDPLERARVRELERVAEMSVLRPVAQLVHATDSPLGLPPVPKMAETIRKELPAAWRLLDDRLADGRPFLAGQRPTIADCTLAAGLQFGRLRGIEMDPECKHLARWDLAYRERAPAQAVLVL